MCPEAVVEEFFRRYLRRLSPRVILDAVNIKLFRNSIIVKSALIFMPNKWET